MKAQVRISAEPPGNRTNVVRCIFALLIAATVSGCSVMADQSIQTSSLTRPVGYPLSSNKSVASKPVTVIQGAAKLERTGYLGRAPYICTPSGFGRTSHCFRR